jgi:hypothetical protein
MYSVYAIFASSFLLFVFFLTIIFSKVSLIEKSSLIRTNDRARPHQVDSVAAFRGSDGLGRAEAMKNVKTVIENKIREVV